jgi:hypothetical protein
MSALRIDRKVELRDVGRGEASGFARVPELISRLNQVSPSLIFRQEGRELRYEQMPGLTPNSFDTQMMALIDQEAVLPMRLTNRPACSATRRAGSTVTAGNIVMTPEDYLALLERERTAAQVERERLQGATEHREGGRSVPAP